MHWEELWLLVGLNVMGMVMVMVTMDMVVVKVMVLVSCCPQCHGHGGGYDDHGHGGNDIMGMAQPHYIAFGGVFPNISFEQVGSC